MNRITTLFLLSFSLLLVQCKPVNHLGRHNQQLRYTMQMKATCSPQITDGHKVFILPAIPHPNYNPQPICSYEEGKLFNGYTSK